MSISFVSNSRLVGSNICMEGMSEPQPEPGESGVYMGKTRIYRAPFYLDTDRLVNPHIVVLGMSGSGKTYFLKSLIARSRMYNSSRVLIIDWNGEYRDTVSFLDGKTLRCGVDARLNVFELFDTSESKGIRCVLDMINRMVGLSREERTVVYNAILNASKKPGARKRLGLGKLIEELHLMQSGAEAKLLQLVGNPLFAERTSFGVDELLGAITSIELSGLRDDGQRGEVARAVLRVIIGAMHRSRMGKGPDVLIVLDEGWRLLGNAEEVSVMFREGRKYGFGLIVATQLAKDINNEALANAACMAIFRLQNSEDYDLLMGAGVIDAHDRQKLSSLDVGSCMIELAERESGGRVRKFLMRRIEGVRMDTYNLVGGHMDVHISGRRFAEETERLDAGGDVKGRIISFVNENERSIDLVALAKLMLRFKLERVQVILYLKSLGVDDLSIIKACEEAEGEVLELV